LFATTASEEEERERDEVAETESMGSDNEEDSVKEDGGKEIVTWIGGKSLR
jgi:hypothetical protein